MIGPNPKRLAVYSALFAILLALAGIWLAGSAMISETKRATSSVRIAIPNQISAGSLVVAENQKFFSKEGVDTSLQRFTLGKDALRSLMENKSDLAVVADTPFAMAVMNNAKISAVSTVFSSRNAMAIVGNKNRGIDKIEHLVGKKIGTVAGTNAQFFLHAMLFASAIDDTRVEVVDLKANDLVKALEDGRVDAITIWNPELAKLESRSGGKYSVIYGRNVFVYRFVLAGKTDYLDTHQEDVRKVLAAISQAVQYIQDLRS